jgi:uracil-DNA glycosylase
MRSREWAVVSCGGVAGELDALRDEIVACRACPRLVEWRERVAVEKRAAFRDETYWGRPLPGFGDPAARIVLVGLAPAAHGANRTGRMFTGDRSGDWLFGALHRAGLANQPTSTSRDDGLRLHGVWIGATVRCAPPDNRPAPDERDACAHYLDRELEVLAPAVVVCLGAYAFAAVCRHYRLRPRPRFGHGVEFAAPRGAAASCGHRPGPTVLCSYHPSQQNTFTGKLTEAMLDDVLARAVAASANRA